MIKGKVCKLDLTELVIDLFDGAISVNMKTGVLKPKTVHVLATNYEVEETDWSKSIIYLNRPYQLTDLKQSINRGSIVWLVISIIWFALYTTCIATLYSRLLLQI